MQNKKIVGLLPMKAHSSRVPNKNFKEICGKPLFRWILDKLLGLEVLDLVVINTDARGLLLDLGVKENENLVVRDRKPSLCGDEVSMNLILADDIQNVPADIYIMTHTTNPLLGVETIRNAITTFLDASSSGSIDSLFSVNRHQARFYTVNGTALNHDPEKLIPTQDLDPLYEENSCLYVFTASSFESTQARIGRKPILVETPKTESIDIDTLEDWEMAEALLARYGS